VERIRRTLSQLTPADRRRFLRYCRWLKFCEFIYLVPETSFSLRAGVLILALLLIMPLHPMAIPTAIGAGISIALMFQNL
jgi:hypothetical protein